jgi:four helix bundle protein
MGQALYSLDDFALYQHAREFRKEVYGLLGQLPRKERFCLDPQMRRAAISVSNNIAEGHGRWHYQENIHFCRISRGSVSELLDDFNLCIDEKYLDPALITNLHEQGEALIRRINGYVSYLQRCKQGSDEK